MPQPFRKLLFPAVLLLVALALRPVAAQDTLRIVALVNDDVITAIDLAVRTEMIIASTGVPDTPESRQRLRPQVLRALVDDRLRQQAADKEGVSVPQDRIDERMSQLAQNNNMSLDQFRDALKHNHIDPNWLEEQIRTEIAWGTLVNKKFRSNIIITDADIDAAERRLQEDAGKTEYRLAEIFLSVDDPNDTETVRESAQRLIEQLKKGSDFGEIARQFSQSSTASNGGVLGWVAPGDLPTEIASAVQGLQPDTVSEPIRSEGGFHILKLLDERQVAQGGGQSRDEISNRIMRDKLDNMARGYLRELRRLAYVDIRQ
ncbi:MAG TPA: peptidylprolyl isomerase [Candidatus Angelobacter sp.]|nr:peptidylprolyl isomerase [Candidatus Angelobacter sp.]